MIFFLFPTLTRMITITKAPLDFTKQIPRTVLIPRFSGAVVSLNLGFGSKPRKEGGFFRLVWTADDTGGMEFLKKLSRGCLTNGLEKGQKVEVENVNGGEDIFDAASAEANVQPQHLVIMVNGLVGSAEDWRYAAEQFVKRLPDKVIVHPSQQCDSFVANVYQVVWSTRQG